jgi:hypothetical protein
LNRPDLVVRVHHRDDRRRVRHQLAQPQRRHDAGLIHRQQRRLPAATRERLEGIQHRFVFDRARDQLPPAARLERVRCAADREVVGLRAAAREHDFRRIAVHERRDRRSRLVERGLGLLAEVMDARGIAEKITCCGRHGIRHFRG